MYCSGEENRYYKYDIFEMYGCVCMCLYISHIKIESCYSLLTCVWRLVTPVSALKVTCECGHVSIFYLVSLAFPWAGTLPAPLLTASYGLQLTDLPAAKSLREAMWGRKGPELCLGPPPLWEQRSAWAWPWEAQSSPLPSANWCQQPPGQPISDMIAREKLLYEATR